MSLTNQLRYTLRNLEIKEFYIRYRQKYVVEKDKKQQVIVKHFLFYNVWQIWIARRFVNKFCLQTNITFNTNYLNLLLAIIVEIFNISKSFSTIYCYIISKFKEIFIFIFETLKILIFYNCIDSCVVISDFTLKLFFAIIRTKQISRIKTKIKNRITIF